MEGPGALFKKDFHLELAIFIDEVGSLWSTKTSDATRAFEPFFPELTGCASLSSSRNGNTLLILTNSGEVIGLGDNKYGQLSGGMETYYKTPNPVFKLKNIKHISCTDKHMLALDIDGVVWGCGDNDNFYMGQGHPTIFTPKVIPDLPPMVTIYASNNAYAIDTSGKLWYWGFIYGVHGPKVINLPCFAVEIVECVEYGSVKISVLDIDDQVWQAILPNLKDWVKVSPGKVIKMSKRRMKVEAEQLLLVDENETVWLQNRNALESYTIQSPVLDLIAGIDTALHQLALPFTPLNLNLKNESKTKSARKG